MKLKFFALLIALMTALALGGCEEKGPMEKAGEKMDEAAEDAADAVEDAADKLEKKVDGG